MQKRPADTNIRTHEKSLKYWHLPCICSCTVSQTTVLQLRINVHSWPYVYVWICMHMYEYMYVYDAYVCTLFYASGCVCMYMYGFICVCLSMDMCAYAWVQYMCVYVCNIFVHTQICLHVQKCHITYASVCIYTCISLSLQRQRCCILSENI